jgi:hypothetical protein
MRKNGRQCSEQKRQNGHHRATRQLRLITANQSLDGRTSVGRVFNTIIRNVVSDLGGQGEITEIERHLITSFAGAAILQGHQLAKLLAGEQVDVDEYSSITTSMIRSATRLGTGRRSKDATPTLHQYLAAKEAAE